MILLSCLFVFLFLKLVAKSPWLSRGGIKGIFLLFRNISSKDQYAFEHSRVVLLFGDANEKIKLYLENF